MNLQNQLFLLAACLALAGNAAAQTSAFTYQGRFETNGTPASGAYSMTFTLYNTLGGGTVIGTPAITYVDANLSWRARDMLELRLGVENLTDELPPQYTAAIQMNTDPSTFDVLGRRYFLRANLKF